VTSYNPQVAAVPRAQYHYYCPLSYYFVYVCVDVLNASVSHTQFSSSSLQYFSASYSQTTFRMCSHIPILPTCRVSYSSSQQEAMNIICDCAFASSFIVPRVNGQYEERQLHSNMTSQYEVCVIGISRKTSAGQFGVTYTSAKRA
jgi:hypothetical protein